MNYLLMIIMCCFLLSCQDENKQTIQIKDTVLTKDIPTHEIWNFSMVFTDSNKTRAILKAGKARVFEQRYETLLDSSVHVDFMNKSSNAVGFMISDSARIDENTRDMFAAGHVFVRSDSTNTTLKTTTLMWKEKQQQFYTKDKVHITTSTEIIDGYGMESDIWLKNYKIFKVSGTKQIE